MGELHQAAYDGDSERVRACLQAGADPNAYDESGYCPLHWVAFKALVGWSPMEVVRLLLEAGADVDATTQDAGGNTALVLSCQAGSEPVARALVAAGADVNAVCGNTTPLIAAAMSGAEAVVRLLLGHGADATAKGAFGMTALEWAGSNGFDGVIEAFHSNG
jgi:ankyrin repeat protein